MLMKVNCQTLSQKLLRIHSETIAPSDKGQTIKLAEETLEAWEQMRKGAKKLMRVYSVRVCGYCPEVHVGPRAQCTELRSLQTPTAQWAAWLATTLDDLIPPRYIWHVPDVNGPPLQK